MHEGNTNNKGHLEEVLQTRARRQGKMPRQPQRVPNALQMIKFKEELSLPQGFPSPFAPTLKLRTKAMLPPPP